LRLSAGSFSENHVKGVFKMRQILAQSIQFFGQWIKRVRPFKSPDCTVKS